jgi:hypothetical protein
MSIISFESARKFDNYVINSFGLICERSLPLSYRFLFFFVSNIIVYDIVLFLCDCNLKILDRDVC